MAIFSRDEGSNFGGAPVSGNRSVIVLDDAVDAVCEEYLEFQREKGYSL